MRALRREVSRSKAGETAEAVKNLLLAEAAIQNASTLAAYVATDGEIDVSSVTHWAQKASKRVFSPVMRKDRIAFVEWRPGTDWANGKFNIPEPVGGEEIAIENCDAALVPGVAFGKDGSRVGRGKGYYDQALAFLLESLRPRPPVLFGICHDFQIIEGLEQSQLTGRDQDIPMDAVVSPAGIHWRN